LFFAYVKGQEVVELFVEPEPGCIVGYHAVFEKYFLEGEMITAPQWKEPVGPLFGWRVKFPYC
jgi:hypothetical protein